MPSSRSLRSLGPVYPSAVSLTRNVRRVNRRSWQALYLMKRSSHVLDWRSRAKWLREIPAYTADILNADVVEFLRDNPPDGCWSDDMSWLPDESLVDDFIDALCDYYESVKGFHGCRPTEMGSYYRSREAPPCWT